MLPPTLKLAASLPEHGKGIPTKRRELKADVRRHTPLHIMCVYKPCVYCLPAFCMLEQWYTSLLPVQYVTCPSKWLLLMALLDHSDSTLPV